MDFWTQMVGRMYIVKIFDKIVVQKSTMDKKKALCGGLTQLKLKWPIKCFPFHPKAVADEKLDLCSCTFQGVQQTCFLNGFLN